MLRTVLIVIGLICIGAAALNVSSPRVSLGWLGVLLIGIAVLLPV